MTILQIGPISYVGGVSVHIIRLNRILNSLIGEFKIKLIDESPIANSTKEVINLRRPSDFIKYIQSILCSDIIHIHSVHWAIRIYNIIFAIILKRKFIVTLHSFRVSGVKMILTLMLLRKAKAVVVVSKEIETVLLKNNITCTVKEAFIPPSLEEEPILPSYISDRIAMESLNKTLVCANAFRLTEFNNKELYGIDQCLDVATSIKNRNLRIFIIFVVGTVRLQDKLYESAMKRIIEQNLDDQIWIIPHQISFIRLIEKCDIILRPTLSDGDALTIREALYLKKRVIASDIVARPNGTILYKTGNPVDLLEKIIESESSNPNIIDINQISSEEYKIFYKNLYN